MRTRTLFLIIGLTAAVSPTANAAGAVDLKLWNQETGAYVDLGPYDVTEGPNPTAPTFAEDTSEDQKKNRLFLLISAAQSGLVNYPYEFWHYSSGDRSAEYCLVNDPVKRVAIYDSVRL